MKYFGNPWGTSEGPAPVCDPDDADSVPQAPTPVGQPCVDCEVQIKEGDQGLLIPYHWATSAVTEEPHHIRCFLQSVTGPYMHVDGFLKD